MITADAPFFLKEDELVKYVANGIKIESRLSIEDEFVEITMRVFDLLVVTNQSVGEHSIFVSTSDLATIEGNGNNDVERFVNCVQRYARAYLMSIAGNAGVNFTIS
ncbi:MAG: hypothetical protein ABIK73_07775 [candidate division WOR-3 bacterium]